MRPCLKWDTDCKGERIVLLGSYGKGLPGLLLCRTDLWVPPQGPLGPVRTGHPFALGHFVPAAKCDSSFWRPRDVQLANIITAVLWQRSWGAVCYSLQG